MKKNFMILFYVVLISIAFSSNAQDIKRTFGLGFQSSFPVVGISAKYAITQSSVIQATIAPFSSGDAKINFYGGRYIYRFINDESNPLNPYVFGGVGLITFSYLGTTSSSFFSYSAGGGVEYIVANALGLSADLGYGKLNVTADAGVAGIFFGAGIHYYIK